MSKAIATTASIAMFTFIAVAPMTAQAAGFAVVEQNASRLGTAYAGGAAEASDASVVHSNPAGMTHLEGRQFSISGVAFLPKIEFSNAGSLSAAGTPLTGDNGGNAAKTSVVPNLYFVDTLNNGMKYGLSVTAPAGVQLKHATDWVGRYYNTKSVFEVVNISPALAFTVGTGTAIGAALDIQYGRARQSKALDFGSACYGIAPPAFCARQGLFPQGADGLAAVAGHDWAFGYHVGIQQDVTPDTRIGLLYHSKVAHKIVGSTRFSGVPVFLSGAFADTRTETEIALPASLSFSGVSRITPALSVMADATWTRWNSFNELRIHFDNPPPTGDDITREEWKNSWRFALGAEYRYTPELSLRAGVARDQTPVTEPLRTPAIPDSSRNTLALGLGYKLSRSSSIDVGYTHLFVAKGPVSLSSALQGTLNGSYDNSVNIVGVQYNQAF